MAPLPTQAASVPWLWCVVLLPLAGLLRARHADLLGLAGAGLTALGALAVALARSPDLTVATARWLLIDGRGLRFESSLSATPLGLLVGVAACAFWIHDTRRSGSESRRIPTVLLRSMILLGLLAGDHLTLVVAIVVAGVLIFLSQRSGEGGTGGANAAEVEAGKLVGVKEVEGRFAGIPQEGAILGDPNAPVTITEYADLRCPACKLFATDYSPTVVDELVRTGKAKYEFRIWPILGTDSVLAAQAGIAAQQQLLASNGHEHTWFCGAWLRNGFHEDGVHTALAVARGIAGLSAAGG